MRQEEKEAVVRATLDATNRRVPLEIESVYKSTDIISFFPDSGCRRLVAEDGGENRRGYPCEKVLRALIALVALVLAGGAGWNWW